MNFISTRGDTPALGFSDAVATGLAPDGGLFLPETLPQFSSDELKALAGLDYPALCTAFFRRFATDIDEATFAAIVAKSYTSFTHPEIAPLVPLADNLQVLELFHGPTLAFKDFALQLLGNLYEHQCAARGQTINVLGATSGDTGAAAIHGLLGKPGTAIFILYPDGRVAPLQERQMTCTGADNVYTMAIEGSFDDAQTALKDIFADQTFRLHHRLSAVNSINLARVLAQCVYYLSAWLRLPTAQQENVEFVVPTGNFGNVLAGWMLQNMGVPIRGFKVATNQNDILYRLFTTGEYKVDQVAPSLAPSMDIQVASNFERFLYFALGRDPSRVREVMTTFKATGEYRFESFDRSTFSASRCSDAEIPGIIKSVYERFGYVADPHTACAFAAPDSDRHSVVLATAHPAKFPDTLRAAIGVDPRHPSLEALKSRPIVKHPVAASADAIRAFIEARAV
ncbi:threonine synthase [Synoicihabitans lomoniglobus]|uniref:Threonine synthase n=1 Tax=Synoicihabitans lomoniglobus TaxID=2909285 RepID=A0AAF0CR36_9BACT|nr:threonine synthase [Opitutaceae bacterium LMO-M01]WED66515.1 threonine synthase [Opitutaceae bacterium LMO-M01]